MAILRTFIGVRIAPPPPLRMLLTRLSAVVGRVTPIDPDKLHVTLKFLGDTRTKLLPKIQAVLRKSVENTPACDVKLVGVGAFPNTSRPAVVWVGLQDEGVLARIAADLEAGLKPLGFRPEKRPFQPHLTLLRLRTPPPDELFALFTELVSAGFGNVRIETVELFESTLLPVGSRHTVLESVHLRG